MRFPPMEVVMSWPAPRYDDPIKRGPALLAIELTILPLALLCLAARIYVRTHILRSTWWDDWCMIAAGICCAGVTVAVILANQLYGWNSHVWDVPFPTLVQGRQISIAGQTIFVFASGFGKLSILLSYLRIAARGSSFRMLTLASIVLINACIIGFLVLLWAQCSPVSSYWNLLATGRDCIPEAPPLMGQCITTVITDFIVYVLPMPTLYQLKLPPAQRVGLMALFGMGSIVVIAGCMRTYWVHFVEVETYDVTWEGFSLWIWAAVEVNLGVICGCVPALRPLIYKVAPGRRTAVGAGTTGASGASGKWTNGKWSKQLSTTGSSAPHRKGSLVTVDIQHTGYYIELDRIGEEGPPQPAEDRQRSANIRNFQC